LFISVPNTVFDNERLQKRFGSLNQDKVNFVNDLKSFILSYSRAGLKAEVEKHQGKLSLSLNGHNVEVTHGVDFFFSSSELAESKQ
jgi:hypothetical protein